MVPFFPRHFWRVPQLFLTSLMGIAYACGVSFRKNPMSSGFSESDKGRTRRPFMFREFEKTAEKETPGVSFFVKLSLELEKSIKQCSKEPPDHYDRGVMFRISDFDLKK